jgi:hypothetical protein
MTVCTRCEGTGFLNADQIPGTIPKENWHQAVLDWLCDMREQSDRLGGCSCHISPPCGFCMLQHDVAVCDCCGDGDGWINEPGEHRHGGVFDCM